MNVTMNMILSLVSPMITSRLGRYFEGDLSKNLSYDSGNIMFSASSLRLKTGTLDELGLPISVKKGYLKSLTIRITIASFTVYIEGKGLFLLVYPQHSSQHFDYAAHKRQQSAIKQSLLRNAEHRMLSTEWEFLNQQPSLGQKWYKSLTKRFLKNVNLNIMDVHIRYQDTSTIAHHPFVMGLTLKSLTAINLEQSEHEQPEEHEEEQKQDRICKKVSVESLSLYLNTAQYDDDNDNIIWNEELLSNEEIIDKFQEIPSKRYRCSYYDYILAPLSLSFIMYIHEHIERHIHENPHNPNKWKARIECKINVERLTVSLTCTQLNTLQLWQKSWKYVLAKMELEQVLNEMKKKRPTKKSGHSKLWWRYVTQCVISLHQNAKEKALGQHINHNGIDWSAILNFSEYKTQYFDLYKRKMRPNSIKNWLKELDTDETIQLQELEHMLSLDQILIFRSLAIAELKEEMEKRKLFIQQREQKKQEENKDSYFMTRMLYNAGNYAKSYVVSEEEQPEQYKLSHVERKRVIFGIDFASHLEKMKLPDSYVRYRFGLIFNLICINLYEENIIASLTITSKLQFQIRPRSHLVGVSLQSLDLKSSFDNIENEQHDIFQSIISSNNIINNPLDIDIDADLSPVQKIAFLAGYDSEYVPSPFAADDLIQIEFESNPLSTTADSRCAINIAPIQFVWNIEWIKKIQKFFDISHMNAHAQNMQHIEVGIGTPDISPALSAISDVSNISNMSNASVRNRLAKSWSKRGQQQLMSALVYRGRHEISVQCDNCIFIIPESSQSQQSKLLVASIDSFRISNELPVKPRKISSAASKSVPISLQHSPTSDIRKSQSSNNLAHTHTIGSISDGNELERRIPSSLQSPFDIVRQNPHKYDTILLKQDNCSLIVYENIVEFIKKGENAAGHKIIDSFCFDITIHRYMSNTDLIKKDDKPRLFILGILPELNFSVSTSTMYTLFDIAGGIVDVTKFQHEILYGSSQKPADIPPMTRRDSVLEDVCDIGQKYENQKIQDTERKINKTSPFNNIITKFKMKEFTLQITDDYYDKTDVDRYYSNDLIKIITKELCINFDKKQDDIHGTLSLQSLFVEDLFQQTSDRFKYLITSQVGDIIPEIKRDANKDLISIDAKTKTKSKLINVICAFNCIHIGWNPDCILAVNNFVDKLKEIQQKKIASHIDAHDIAPDLAEHATLEPLVLNGMDMDVEDIKNAEEFTVEEKQENNVYLYENADGVKVKSELELHIEVGLRFVGITLCGNMEPNLSNAEKEVPKTGPLLPPQCYRSLVRLIAENVTLNIEKYARDYYYVEGDLGNLHVCDLRENTLYPDILSLKSKDNPQIGRFEFFKYDKYQMNASDFPDGQMYDKKLKFHMNSIKVVYFNPFLSEIVHYIMHSLIYVIVQPEPDDVRTVQQSLEEKKPDSYHESMAELQDMMSSHFRLDISTSNPVLIIPRHFESPQYFSCDLGSVSIQNKCQLDETTHDLLDIITIQTSQFKLATYNNDITSNIKTTIQLKRKMNLYCQEPDNIFTIHVPEYNAVMRHEQFTLILKLLSGNVTAEPMLAPIPYTVDHIKHIQAIDLQPVEERPDSSSFKLQIDKASLTLMHDLVKGRHTDIQLAKLQLSDVVMANLSTRSSQNTFSVKIGSGVITDSRNLANHVFDKILCRVQDIVSVQQLNKDILERDKLPSFELIWNTKEDLKHKYNTQDIQVSIVDSCSFCIGSAIRHLYDWFTTTNDSFLDQYPEPKCIEKLPVDDRKNECQEWDSEFNVNVNLINSRLILLRDLTKANCDALVTQGNVTVNIKNVNNFTEMFAKNETEIKLNDFKLHFAKGNHLGFGKDDRIQVLEPSNFHFHNTYYHNFTSQEELYEKEIYLKKITVIGVTTKRAVALKDIISDFVSNFNENAFLDLDNDTEVIYNAEEAEEDDDILHTQLQEEKVSVLPSINEATMEPKYRSELNVEFERLDVFMHDETAKDTPKIFSFGFHNFHLSAVSDSPKLTSQHMTINMLWHANKHYNDTWSPLVCPWNCQIEMRQSSNPATSVVIEGKEALDVFVSDIVIRAFVKNATKWVDAFKIDTSVPNVSDVQNKFIQNQEDENQSNIKDIKQKSTPLIARDKANEQERASQSALNLMGNNKHSVKEKKMFTKYRFKFIVPKFSMYIEQPVENRTLCKIVSSEYSVIYVGDQQKDTVEIKMKCFSIYDFVQNSGKNFSKLIESMHSKRAKHTEFLYIWFEHWKLPRIKKAKDKLQLYLDTLKINYNPDTVLTLINFANSITEKTVHSNLEIESKEKIKSVQNIDRSIVKKPRIKDTSLTLRLSFDFRQLFINLNKPHLNRQIVEFGLSKTHITFKLYRDFSCDLHGRIGNLTAKELTFEGLYAAKMLNNLDCTILGLRDANSKTLLDFKYSTNLIDGIHHRYRQELKVTLSSVKFKYYQLLVMEIVDYINMGILGMIYTEPNQQETKEEKKQQPDPEQKIAAADFANDVETKLFYTVAIDKPVIVFPYSRGNENSLDFDLGSINISNKIKQIPFGNKDHAHKLILVEDINVRAKDMQIIGSHNRSLRMVKVSLNIDVRRGVDCKIELEPNMQINLQFDKFQIKMTQQHYKDILNMLNGNIWANPNNIRISTASIGDEKMEYLSFYTKTAKQIYTKYNKNSHKDDLKKAIIQINDLIKNSGKATPATIEAPHASLSPSKSAFIPIKIKPIRRGLSVDVDSKMDNNSDRHTFVDDLMKLRVLYEQYLFNYAIHKSELDKVLSALNQKQPLPPPTSKVLRNKSTIFKDVPLPPPIKPNKSTKTPRVRRKLSKQQNVTNEFDAMRKHGLINEVSNNNKYTAKTAVHFTFDDVEGECMSMRVLVNMEELKLSLCENRQSPFCQFSINGFDTEWNRQHNGNHDTYLTIKAIQLKKISKGAKQQQYTQMLCPFDQIQMFVANNQTASHSSISASTSLSPLSISGPNTFTFQPKNISVKSKAHKQRPEIIFTYDSKQNGNTSTKLTVNEPCGFLLPSVIKRLQEFFDVTSDSDMINISAAKDEIDNDDTQQFIANWTSNTEFKLNNGKFICLENPNVVNTNAVVLNVSLGMRHGSVPNINPEQNKCVVHSNTDINIESLNALICPANQIYNVGQRGGVRMHTIIEQQRLKCHISGEEHVSMLTKQTLYKDLDVNGEFDKLDFTISFIDIQIFQNIMNSIQHTFSPQNQTPLAQRIASLVPMEGGLRDNYAKLRTQGHAAELCFEALMKYTDLQLAASYCVDYSKSFVIRQNRGDINELVDLLPSNMYHNFRELAGRYDEQDIIRALVIGDNQLDKATLILNQASLQHFNHMNEANKPIIEDNRMNDRYFDEYNYDADDADDEDEYNDYNDYEDEDKEKNKDKKKNKYPVKVKINLTFESEKGIEINLINDVMSSSAMPFVGIKLYSMHLVWTKDIERTKGTFTFDIQSKYYNPMIVTMEPLLESSRVSINWNSMPASSNNLRDIPLYTIKVNVQGIPHERSALVPKIIPVNINITHIFGKTLLETLHSWSHFAATRRNRIITAWKPFYIVNKTGELLSVWPSSEKNRQQEILPMEVQALSIRGGVRAAFTGRLLKYNRLEISFKVGNVACFEQISVFQNRRRKIMHKKHKVCVVLHTVFRKGSKFVYIWSPTEIRNHTARPLRIRLHFEKKALRVPTFEFMKSSDFKIDHDDLCPPDPDINDTLNKFQCIDFGVIEPGASVPVPLSINSLESHISFKPTINAGWNYTKLQKIRDLISSQKFTLIKSKWKTGYLSETKAWQKIESFFLRPRYHRDLITIIIQSPLIITNLFPFPIRIQIKLKNQNKRVWEQRIAAYESLPVTTDFEWQHRSDLLMGVWIPGFGQSDWVRLPFGDNIEPIPIPIEEKEKKRLIVYLSNRACKSVPFFRDDAPATLAMNMLYLYTKYLFINKTGLELEIRSPKQNLSIKQMEVEIEIFENERKNVHGEWVAPFEPLDIASQCDRTHRPRNKQNVILPNKKWKWKHSEWKVSEWEYARDFNYSFHAIYDDKNKDEVRRRKWSRIRIPKNNKHNKMLGTISCFGGANTKINNKICCRVLDKNHRTDWSQYIPLTEAVTNMVLSIKSLANHKVFFDIAVIFELHRLYPAIKVIKFYPRFVGLNCCTFIDALYVRPCYVSAALQATTRNGKPNPDRYKYDDGKTNKNKVRYDTTSPSSRQRLHLNRKSADQYRQSLLIDDSKRDERVLYLNESSGANGSDEMLYSTALHWFNILPTRYIQASIDCEEWSSPFPIHEITQFPIRVVNKNDSINKFSIIRVQSRTIGQTTIVVFRDERRDYPFFQIHNQTKYTIYYAQHIPNPNITNKFYPISTSSATPFAWNNLLISKKKRKLVIKIRDKQFDKAISFDSNGYINMFNVVRKSSVYIQVQNRGATKVLTISETFQQEKDYENESNIDLNIRIDSFGISLIDELPQELLYIAGDKLQFNLLLSRNEQRIRFTLDSFQIDNQMNNAISSVLFVGIPVPARHSKTNKKLPWLDFQLNLCSQTSSSKYVQILNVRPQKFALSLDGATLQKLINFFYVFTSITSYQNSSSSNDHNGKDEPQPMYFGQLFLAPMEFIVSFRDLDETFINENKADTDMNSNYDEYCALNSSTKQHLAPLLNDKRDSSNNGNVPLLNDIMFQFGVVVVNFDCAVIRVSGYAERDRVFDSLTLINRLSSHYSGELLRGFFNIIGSLEILGNIAGLTNSVRSGLQDFWFEPQAGTTPGEVFRGFGKGTYSLLQQSIQGITHSVSSLTSALGTGLAYASGDTDFAKHRSMLKGKQDSKPKNMADGIFKGGKKLASHSWAGISGIWKDPIQGGQEDGVKGAIAGFGQGVMGLVCKPLVGVMDLGSDLVSGIGNTLPSVTNQTLLINSTRKRKTRMFYSRMNIMKEYKYSDALIKENLTRMDIEYNRQNEEDGRDRDDRQNKLLSFISFEGSFETEPNHQHELFIILGNGLLLCRWSQSKQNKLKFVSFYPWKSFFSISNRPGKRMLICTFKLQQRYYNRQNINHPNHPNPNQNHSFSNSNSNSTTIKKTATFETQSSLTSNLAYIDSHSYKTQKDLRLPLKSAKLAEIISKKLSQYIRTSQRQ